MPVLKWLPKCYSSAHQSSREKICPFFQHILLKDINSLSPPANPCFSFYFCQLHLLQSFWAQSLKGLCRVEMVPLQQSYFKYLSHLSVLCYFAFDQCNALIHSTETPFLRRLLWVCQHMDCCPSWSQNYSKPAWVPETVHLHITVFCLEGLVSLNNHSVMPLPEMLRNFYKL